MKKKLSRDWKKWAELIGFLLLAPSLILNFFLWQRTGQGLKNDEGILVIAVLDGDTLVLDGKTRLRLRQVDAPELEYCAGPESKDFLEKLVKDKKIIIQEKILDQRGRAMSLVYIGNTLINKEILENGWGRYHSDQTTQREALKEAAAIARENKRGIFSPQCYQMENLENPRCIIKGNIDKNTKVKRYYYPSCAQYKFAIVEKDIGEQWFCTEKEAQQAGYEKAETCHEKFNH